MAISRRDFLLGSTGALGAATFSFPNPLSPGGRDMTNATPREAARTGLVHVTEGHRVFTQISVTDNLLLAGYDLPRSQRATQGRGNVVVLSRDCGEASRGGALSGGQRQMLPPLHETSVWSYICNQRQGERPH